MDGRTDKASYRVACPRLKIPHSRPPPSNPSHTRVRGRSGSRHLKTFGRWNPGSGFTLQLVCLQMTINAAELTIAGLIHVNNIKIALRGNHVPLKQGQPLQSRAVVQTVRPKDQKTKKNKRPKDQKTKRLDIICHSIHPSVDPFFYFFISSCSLCIKESLITALCVLCFLSKKSTNKKRKN